MPFADNCKIQTSATSSSSNFQIHKSRVSNAGNHFRLNCCTAKHLLGSWFLARVSCYQPGSILEKPLEAIGDIEKQQQQFHSPVGWKLAFSVIVTSINRVDSRVGVEGEDQAGSTSVSSGIYSPQDERSRSLSLSLSPGWKIRHSR